MCCHAVLAEGKAIDVLVVCLWLLDSVMFSWAHLRLTTFERRRTEELSPRVCPLCTGGFGSDRDGGSRASAVQ